MTKSDALAVMELEKSYSARALAEFIALMRPDIAMDMGWSAESVRGNQLFGDQVLADARAAFAKHVKEGG